MMNNLTTILSSALVMAVATAASAQNVDLSTVPPRDGVQLTIYNSEDLTLVRETRTISFKKGINPLQYSWAGTLIDATSVDLRFKTHAGELDLLDTTFPHAKPQMLYWNVQSEFAGDAVVEISYFTSGIGWSADYVCVSDPAEEHMRFDGFVRIVNRSGEDYADAQIRMVVGTINLVEKVADLARRGMISRDDAMLFQKGARGRMSRKAKSVVRNDIAGAFDMMEADSPREIIKEGLSEYFIYTVPGTETVKHSWSKRMQLFQGLDVPFSIQYRYRPAEYGQHLARLFLLHNDEKSGLGSTPLPDGIVRLYRDNGRDGLSFLVAQTIEYVPVGQEIVLNLGRDPEVIHERLLISSKRDNFWFRRGSPVEYFSPTKGNRIRRHDGLVGWDDRDVWIERIRNYHDKPIAVAVRRGFPGHVVFRSGLDPKLYDFHTVQFSATIGSGQKRDLSYELVVHQGYNKKQENVTLEEEG